MHIELWRHRDVIETEQNGKKRKHAVEKYKSVNDIQKGMDVCLESIDIIRRLIDGLELEVFRNDRAILDRCAVNFMVIGNQLGMLDDPLQLNDAMRTARKSRDIIAHRYGTEGYDTQKLWRDLHDDLDSIESGCREVKRILSDPDTKIVFSHGKRGAGYQSHLWRKT